MNIEAVIKGNVLINCPRWADAVRVCEVFMKDKLTPGVKLASASWDKDTTCYFSPKEFKFIENTTSDGYISAENFLRHNLIYALTDVVEYMKDCLKREVPMSPILIYTNNITQTIVGLGKAMPKIPMTIINLLDCSKNLMISSAKPILERSNDMPMVVVMDADCRLQHSHNSGIQAIESRCHPFFNITINEE